MWLLIIAATLMIIFAFIIIINKYNKYKEKKRQEAVEEIQRQEAYRRAMEGILLPKDRIIRSDAPSSTGSSSPIG